MRDFTNRLRRLLIYAVVSVYFITLGNVSLSAKIFAEEADVTNPPAEASTPEEPVAQSTEQPPKPKEPSFIYNPETGLWESKYYTWDPVTRQTTIKHPTKTPVNPTPESPEHAPQAQSSNAADTETPTVSPQTLAGPSSNQQATSHNPVHQAALPLSAATLPGPGQEISVSPNNNNYTHADLLSNAAINNQIDSSAITGNASVLQNTTAGSATSGDAVAMANVLNMLQSTWSADGLLPQIYVADIQGEYVGDIIIDPSLFSGIQAGNCSLCGETIVNSTTNNTINNDINLSASTGNATVSSNTTAGNATTGDAAALANVINMISSSITSGQSFLGVINVHGNLEGDIIVASDVINELIAANVPTTEISLCPTCGNILAELNSSQSVTNNVSMNAASGSANISMNTNAGNATSGNAATNLTVFNLTGHTVVGRDALLVFVNVQGEWVGFITNAPEGSTAAAFGGGLTENSYLTPGGEYNIENNMMINNNIDVSAISGDAEVSYNTSAGNATSGNATASVNLANVMDSSFSLTGWFGILFINVLGDWFGSFGINTAYGNGPIIESYSQTPATGIHNVSATSQINQPSPTNNPHNRFMVFSVSFEDDDNDGGMILASVSQIDPPSSTATTSSVPATILSQSNNVFTTLALVLAIAAAFGLIMHGDNLKMLIFKNRQL